MTMHLTARDRSVALRRRCDEAAFRRLFVATYPVFFAIALADWLLSAAGLGREGDRRSVFQRARATAHAVIPFAFMG